MKKLVFDVGREAVKTEDISYTYKVSDLMDVLSKYDPDMPVYFGSDKQARNRWFTYSRVTVLHIEEVDDGK